MYNDCKLDNMTDYAIRLFSAIFQSNTEVSSNFSVLGVPIHRAAKGTA